MTPDALPVLPPLRDVIARHGLAASKALGQNFLLDEQLLSRIAAIPKIGTDDLVYEVGPGPGGLSRAILRRGATLIAVERDARCIPALGELSAAFPGQMHLIEGDAAAVDVASATGGKPHHIIANLPYNVGTHLLLGWLNAAPWPPSWQSLTLMFQAEVAERLIAKAGDDAYGRLSILAQWRSDAKIAMRVHRSAFTPAPKVMSAVVHITPKAQPDGVRPAVLETLTAAAFGQRRKMLRQSVKSVPGALDALAEYGIAGDRRAETLSVADFIAVAQILSR